MNCEIMNQCQTALSSNLSLLDHFYKVLEIALTPIILWILGKNIANRLEQNKLEYLKEKEWQVKWAERFVNLTMEYQNNLSKLIHMASMNKEDKEYLGGFNKLMDLYTENSRLSHEIETIIILFPKYEIEIKKNLIDIIKVFLELKNNQNKKLDLSKIIKLQKEGILIARKAHKEILNMN